MEALMRLLNQFHYFQNIGEGQALPDLEPRLTGLLKERPRRIDRFILLTLYGSATCAQGQTLSPNCGLYVSSGIGPVGNNIVVQQAIFREYKLPMPFHFVNTLGSSAGYYAAKNLGLGGQTFFISRRGASLKAALELAETDLKLGILDQALVGVVEECTLPLSEHRSRLGVLAEAPVAEGTHWFLVDGQGEQGVDGILGELKKARGKEQVFEL
jgi:hypothetical protein